MVPSFFAQKTHILAYHLATVRNVLDEFAQNLALTSVLAARFITQNFVNNGSREIRFLDGSQFFCAKNAHFGVSFGYGSERA